MRMRCNRPLKCTAEQCAVAEPIHGGAGGLLGGQSSPAQPSCSLPYPASLVPPIYQAPAPVLLCAPCLNLARPSRFRQPARALVIVCEADGWVTWEGGMKGVPRRNIFQWRPQTSGSGAFEEQRMAWLGGCGSAALRMLPCWSTRLQAVMSCRKRARHEFQHVNSTRN